MEEIIKKIIEKDPIAFLGIITPIIVPTISIIIQVFNNTKKNKKFVAWEAKKKIEGDFFYVFILLYSCASTVLLVFTYGFLNICKLFPLLLKIIALILVEIVLLIFINKRKFVRQRIRFGNKILKIILINTPIIAMCSMAFLLILEISNNLTILLMYVVLIAELFGLLVFQGRYIRYEYSYVDLIFKTANQLTKVKVDKILKKGDWLIIQHNDRKIKILQDELLKAEYYGGCKYVFNKKLPIVNSKTLSKTIGILKKIVYIFQRLKRWFYAKLQEK